MSKISETQKATKDYIIFRGFETMDTQSARQALPVNRLAWCENLQIVGPNQLIAVNGPAPSIANLAGEIILSMFSANFTPPGGVNADYIICFCQSGAAYQVNAVTGASVRFALSGTFSPAPDMTVWSSQRILIADPTAGYCTWDGHVFVQSGGVSPNIVITNGGSGYGAPPSVTISGGSGAGATAHAVLTGGVVTSVVLDSSGTGFKAGDTLTVTFGSGTAAATAIVWPFFALTPTTLAVFAGRVWLAGARNLTWTGTKGFDDAAAADAAGSTVINDADLVHQITALRALNNFLYIFGDNSIKQIGTVTVSGSTTIFNIVTLSSDQGTPFPRAITSYNRLILFANKVGVYAILGASVEKVSDPMDGIFALADFTQPFQAAVQDLHTSLHTFLLLIRYKDPLQSITRSLILCFYKNRWFVASQGNQLTAICTASIAGLTETFASSGSDVTQIFQSNVAVPIIFRTSLSDNNAPHQGKRALRAAIMLSTSNFTTANFTVDTENGSQLFPFLNGSSMIFLNNFGNQVNFVNNSNQPVNFFTTGLLYQRTGAAGTGIYLGLSLTGVFTGGSGTGGFTINQAILEYQDNAVMASKMNA
jgi:hypothetical protein